MASAISAATKITLANEDYWKVTVEDLSKIENQNKGTTLGDHLTYMISGERGHDRIKKCFPGSFKKD